MRKGEKDRRGEGEKEKSTYNMCTAENLTI